jgi:hypothetical protein
MIVSSSVCTGLFCATLAIEKWLRHNGQLLQYRSKWMFFLSIASMAMTTIGSIGVIFLSIFNIRRHNAVHYGFVAVFL